MRGAEERNGKEIKEGEVRKGKRRGDEIKEKANEERKLKR